MSIAEFACHRPATLAEACALGRQFGDSAAFLAGGTELIPDYHRERETATHLIALQAIAALHGISLEQGELRIGALTTIADLAASAAVRRHFPALAEAAHAIGTPQVRAVATIGGNFCRAVPCADTPPATVVAGGRVRLVGPEGERTIDAELFFTGARQTVLRRGEVLVEVWLPAQPDHSGASYQRFARRRGSSLAIAAVAARVTLVRGRIAGARIALGAVAPTPLLVPNAATLLEGEVPSEALFANAAALAAAAALPITDLRGTALFRRDLVVVLARRALREAASRASGAAA